MQTSLELFALLAAVLLAGLGITFVFAAFKSPTINFLLINSSVVLFILSGLLLILGWNYFYSSGFWIRPAAAESKPVPNLSIQPVATSSLQHTEQTNSRPLDPVFNGFWDGSVRQVKEWLKENLKDPDSFKAIDWSAVRKTSDGGYVVRCKYRAKNSFGGYDIANQNFFMDSEGNVLRCVDVSY